MTSVTHPMLREEEIRVEQRRLVRDLRRLRDGATLKFQRNAKEALRSCRRELEAVLPQLVDHFTEEQDVLGRPSDWIFRKPKAESEQVISENISRLRELRAILESAKRVLEDPCGEAAARGLCAYLEASVVEILEHEAEECPFPFPASEKV